MMPKVKVVSIKPGESLAPETLQEIAAAVKACKIVAFPTDTVYGLGSNGLVKAALRRIYQVKGRDSAKPLPILLRSLDEARRWAEWTPQAEILARKFWPGPLTLVLKPTQEGRLLTFQEFPTIAVRVPAHPIISAILAAADVPMVSSSANISGRPAIASGDEIFPILGDMIDWIVDAGPVPGVASTVVDAVNSPVRVLREGKLARDEIFQAMKTPAAEE